MNRWILVLCLAVLASACQSHTQETPDDHLCPTARGEMMANEVPLTSAAQTYQETFDKIFSAAKANRRAYQRFAALCDDIGPRLSGSKALDKALLWAKAEMEADGHENVAIEPVQVPKWVRGEESLALVEPYAMSLKLLGLGGSVATPPEGITAEVVVVSDKAELDARDDVDGKIVVFNHPMPAFDPATNATGYGDTVQFRSNGARWAAAKGAVAVLVRSVTTHSLDTPHTGGMNYGDAQRKIPAASITLEAAEQLARLQARGQKTVVHLKMEAKNEGMIESGNVVAELRGSEFPDEIVVIGGHIDSWDVGQGARDNASGVVISMEALATLRELGIQPKRTIRVVLWTNEENGLAGAVQYAKAHKDELDKHVAGIESDSGGAHTRGFNVHLEDQDQQARMVAAFQPFAPLFAPIDATEFVPGFGGADLGPLRSAGIPTFGQRHDLSSYFDIHHTHADTVEKLSEADLQQGIAAMAGMALLLTDHVWDVWGGPDGAGNHRTRSQ